MTSFFVYLEFYSETDRRILLIFWTLEVRGRQVLLSIQNFSHAPKMPFLTVASLRAKYLRLTSILVLTIRLPWRKQLRHRMKSDFLHIYVLYLFLVLLLKLILLNHSSKISHDAKSCFGMKWHNLVQAVTVMVFQSLSNQICQIPANSRYFSRKVTKL